MTRIYRKFTLLRHMLIAMAMLAAATLPSSASDQCKLDTFGIEPSLFPAVPEGYTRICVPDSMLQAVQHLLDGRHQVVDNGNDIDLEETTVFRGDTIPMVLRDRNLGRFDRGLFNWLFIPRGTWKIGATASYGEVSTSDLQAFSLLSDVDVSGHIFSIKPYISYFIRDNLSVGVKLIYSNSKARIDSFNVDIDEDMNFNLKDIMYRNEEYSAAMTLNQYIGISRRGRFGVTNEIEVAFASGNGDFNRPYDSVMKNTHTTYMETRLNFSPGVCVLVMENVSLNVSLGVFGLYLRNEKQTVDGQPLGNRFTSGANFRINLFNISLGLGIHI